jgi:tRNA G46 methylase TrmB
MKWLNRPDLDYIAHLSPAYANLYAANKQAIESDLKNVRLTEDVKSVLLKYLMNKCTIQKLSILNLKIIKKKSVPLLEHIDTYLEIN